MNGGAFVLPRLQAKTDVNMNTLRLEVVHEKEDALITRDRMRVDVMAEFYVRVKNDEDSVAIAARTLGYKTMNSQELLGLIKGKFVDALRSVAAEMAMKELHEKRTDFIEKVQMSVVEDLAKNGLELEAVSLTGLDQTSVDYFDQENAFDAEGLVRLAEITEARRKERNDIEQNMDLAIKAKNLEAERQRLQMQREEEYAKLEQEREIAIRRVEQETLIAAYQIEKQRETKEAKIAAELELDLKRIVAEREIKSESIRTIQSVELAEQERAIAIAEKSRMESAAKAREMERAERSNAVELIAAQEAAQKEAIAVKVSAAAERQAALDRAEAKRIVAQAESDAKMMLVKAQEEQYRVDAQGTEAINKASNILSDEQIEMQVRLNTLKHLPDIIRESVKPMENIDDIKILQVNGLGGVGNVSGSLNHGEVSLSDQMVNSALRYRSQAPLVDSLLKEIGLNGADINGLTQGLHRPLSADDNVIEQQTTESSPEPNNENEPSNK